MKSGFISVIGRPNVGKSTLLNQIMGEKLTITSNKPQTTRNSIQCIYNSEEGQAVFIDTPGIHKPAHVLDSKMMKAVDDSLADIDVLVVMVEPGKPREDDLAAISRAWHAKAHKLLVINKIDTVDKTRLLEVIALYSAAYDFDAVIPISAKTGMGVDNLLEMVALTAEVGELKANPNRAASGAVIEARLDKGRGPIATLLVQNGTLHQGDIIIAGTAVGRVRMMTNDKGQKLTSAGPSVPVEITGLGEVPGAGANFNAVADERMARELVEERKQQKKDAANYYNTVKTKSLYSWPKIQHST